jgi:5-formyltetrahydrofolate cyclo-ligase
MPPGSRPSKAALRKQFRSYRRSLSEDDYRRKSRSVADRTLALPEIRSADLLHVYWPQQESREVDTRPIIDTLHGLGTRLVLPVVTSFPPRAPAMEHQRYEGRAQLRLNRWGIAEPHDGAWVDPAALDAVVVPALGAGANGHRIGHGAGYYDAFLAPLSVPRIVLTYEGTFVEHVPSAPHDVPATLIVTESRACRP